MEQGLKCHATFAKQPEASAEARQPKPITRASREMCRYIKSINSSIDQVNCTATAEGKNGMNRVISPVIITWATWTDPSYVDLYRVNHTRTKIGLFIIAKKALNA